MHDNDEKQQPLHQLPGPGRADKLHRLVYCIGYDGNIDDIQNADTRYHTQRRIDKILNHIDLLKKERCRAPL